MPLKSIVTVRNPDPEASLQIKQAVDLCVISYGIMYLHNQTCFVLVFHKVTDLYFNWGHDY